MKKKSNFDTNAFLRGFGEELEKHSAFGDLEGRPAMSRPEMLSQLEAGTMPEEQQRALSEWLYQNSPGGALLGVTGSLTPKLLGAGAGGLLGYGLGDEPGALMGAGLGLGTGALGSYLLDKHLITPRGEQMYQDPEELLARLKTSPLEALPGESGREGFRKFRHFFPAAVGAIPLASGLMATQM